jgi:polysaccharide biosynthesis transport protein
MDLNTTNKTEDTIQGSQPPYEAKPFESELMGILNIATIVRERLWWGLLAAFVLSLSFIFYTYTQPKLYEGDASLIVENKSDKVVEIQQVVDPGLQNEKDLINYEEQMNSRRFCNYVVDSFTPAEVAKILKPYRDELGKAPSLASFFGKGNLGIKRNGQVFKITVLHRDPECAALLTNRFVERYIAFQIDRSDASNNSALKFLEDQVNETRKKVELGEAALQAYRAKFNMVSLADSQNLVVARMKGLSDALTGVQVQKLTVDTQVAQIETVRENGDFMKLLDIPAVHGFTGIMETYDSLEVARAERAKLSAVYKARHPKIVEIDAQITKQSESLNHGIEMAIAGIKHQQSELNDRVLQLKAELGRAEKAALNLDKMAIDYTVLSRQIDTDKQTFEQMLSRRNDTAISSRLSNTNVRILDVARIPDSSNPKYPNNLKSAVIFAMLFLLGLLGVPYFVDLLDNRLKSSYDIESFLHKPPLGDLPMLKNMNRKDLAMALINDSNADIVDMFRSAFASISLQTDNRMDRVFLVTSTIPAEGKSFFASNFAGVCAKHGSRTLIIDCDLRRPSLHKSFDTKNEKGLITYLNGKLNTQASLIDGQLPDLGIINIGENCFFLPSGGTVKNATELFDSKRFADLMARLKKAYDTIIIDTPPLGVFPDLMFLANHADHTIFIARFNMISRQRIRQLIHEIDETPAKVLGVVINCRNSKKGIRYGYGYNYTYGHYYNNSYGYYGYDRKKYRHYYELSESDQGK